MCCIVPNNTIPLIYQFKIMIQWFRSIKTWIFLILVTTSFTLQAQDTKSSCDVYREIAHMDSVLFNAFNNRDLEKFKTLFTEDLEFYHDKGGLTDYNYTINSLKNTIAQNNGLRRELIKGSLEAYCIKDYGAVQIGSHTFCHPENGKMDCGTFKFVHVWKKINNEWKISRVISYDH